MLVRIHEWEQKLDQKQVLGAIVFRKIPKDQMLDK